MLRTVLLEHGELHAENDKLRLLIQRLTRQFDRGSGNRPLTTYNLPARSWSRPSPPTGLAGTRGYCGWSDAQTSFQATWRLPGVLPEHALCYEVADVDGRICTCCGHALYAIGKLSTAQLVMVPSRLRVRPTRQLRYACRGCETIVASAPDRAVVGGMPMEALIVHVWSESFPTVCRSTGRRRCWNSRASRWTVRLLAKWAYLAKGYACAAVGTPAEAGGACWWLTPLNELILATMLVSPKAFGNDTTLLMLDPGRTKTGQLWCHAVDDRPWCGAGNPIAVYVYSDERKDERPAGHLSRFRGVMQIDGYNGFEALVSARTNRSVELAFCWSHIRRYFYDQYVSDQSPLAAEPLVRVRSLYAIDGEIRGHRSERRRTIRQERSRPIVEALHGWLHD